MLPPDRPVLDARLRSAALANLSLSRDAGVRAAVAAHPNTSASILGVLAAEFPREVLRNPALPLLRLAQPNLVQHWPVGALVSLVTQVEAPDWVLRQALACPATEVLVAVARHPRLPPLALEVLAIHPAWLVRARVAARPDVPPALLQQLARDPDDSVRLAVASRRSLGVAEFAALSRDPSRFVQQVLRQSGRAAVDT